MPAEDTPRLLIIDLENVVGPGHPRQRVLRSRITALLDAAGPVHHAVAGYAVTDLAEDPTASVLAELRVAPLRVPPAPDAAELVLLAHARRVHDTLKCRTFLVASADRRFADLAHLGRLELLVWHDQPIASKLEDAAHQVHRIPRPTLATTELPDPEPELDTEAASQPAGVILDHDRVGPVITALLTGVGIGIG